jgi:5-formyltetrahydrofolate cyclo-ligase
VPDFAGEARKSPPDKAALRSRLLTARNAMTASELASAAASVQAALLSLVRAKQPTSIAAYVPVGREPGGPDLPEVLARAAQRLLLPVLLDDGDLEWAAFDSSLVAGPRGLLQPGGARLGVDAVGAAGLVVVPALAVDRAGRRLGRGGGSYDRALARACSAITVALLYDGEILEAVPVEPHDRAVRAAITPRGGIAYSTGSEWTK